MKIWISTDLEGVCGVQSGEEPGSDRDTDAYRRARKRQLAENQR